MTITHVNGPILDFYILTPKTELLLELTVVTVPHSVT